VYFLEEPEYADGTPEMWQQEVAPNVTVLRPRIPAGVTAEFAVAWQRQLLDDWLSTARITPDVLWYYTPAALSFSHHLEARMIVYDCMDELAAFAGAPAALPLLERQLLSRCHVVFTGGMSLYEAKASLHGNCHVMPSSVDVPHFRRARQRGAHPMLLRTIPSPRIGYSGVLDERLDLELMGAVADARPAYQFVFVGPVTKIDPGALPRRANVHYVGAVPYDTLPECMSGWQAAWMPFALNAATRYISPTKTPEYLAAGLPVVSTPIQDVVRTWGTTGLVRIGASASDVSQALDAAMQDRDPLRLARIDRALSSLSWDATWQRMSDVMARSAAFAA
jgi:UDP-galactopyranose mutase